MFKLAETKIFKFEVRTKDGIKVKSVDPLKIQRRLLISKECDLEKDIKLLMLAGQEGGPQKEVGLEAMDRLIHAAHHAFGIEEYHVEDGIELGMLDAEIMELVLEFGQFMQKLKNV